MMQLQKKYGFVILLFAPSVLLPMTGLANFEGDLAQYPSAIERTAFADEVRGLVQSIVDKQERIPGQLATIRVKVSIPDEGSRITVDLGRGYVPSINGGELEDLLHQINIHVYTLIESRALTYDLEFRFERKRIDDYFDDDLPQFNGVGRARLRRDVADARLRVVVAAGHGKYYHRHFKKWLYQREEHNGIIEDAITPRFAWRLGRYLTMRSGVEVFRVRADGVDRHGESGEYLSSLGARYYLQSILPDVPSIWNSFSSRDYGLVERDEDIRSRPFYANYLKADALIHIHTNASSSHVRGVRVYYYDGRSTDRRLAENALCYMRESIHSVRSFQDFPVSLKPHPGDQGENKHATMPSIIAEVGFHTNAEDANAIQHPLFQDAAMRGLEKGYRLFREGKGCDPFTVNFPDSKLISGSSVEVEIAVGGNPRYPIHYTTYVKECTPGIICVASSGVFYSEDQRKVTHRSCNGAKKPFRMVWGVTARDDDGVTATTETSLVCQPRA
ncbi:N-acetylmuramoyl-L-alanine amidase [Luteibacter anthropi]|uniref:N-acetylmuramoyl-L-alanine amidase family protein n=1 Tax=Luteibacter anthropi TaxID=564369 RepID=UPI0020328A29|nr:N-acetylmuramoyl-L-alanine amidase [Luteibacter anthropi]URX64032.1 N-acetylmuramoyl-L-alanine amidase [Luteibacter anthropi]